MPWHDPKAWAINYYLQCPSLTILVYPPLFYIVEAAAYALFGVSHVVTQATVGLFTLILATAAYNLAPAQLSAMVGLGGPACWCLAGSVPHTDKSIEI